MKNLQLKPQEKRGAIAWMAGHSVAANLIMLVCLIGGFLSLRNIKQEVFPDLTFDSVIVSVPYPGASPEDVESGILLSIEEAVRGLDGVDEVTSVANEGSGRVVVDLLLGADVQKLAQDVKTEVDRITTFPDDAEEPRVTIASHKREVLEVVLYGDVDRAVLHEVAEQTRDQLLQDPGITQIDLTGLPALEISIEISQENLRRYGLTLDEVASRISSSSMDVAGGGIKTESGEILVRMKERRDYGRQFARLPIITTEDGSEVYLDQIAIIDDSYADTDRYSTYNGKLSVVLEVYRVGEQTPIQVAESVREQLKEIIPGLPPGIQAAIEHDRSEIYEQRINLLLKNGALGLALVLILLGLFLEVRLAFWVMMGIPISFLGSFLILPSTGVTVNMISLFAYIIALGIVVDDAIVVGENIYYYHQEGMPFLAAATRGAREVAKPVTFSILTNIVTFMPIYMIPGTMGKIFKMIPIVVCTVFLISLFECLFILPAHLGHQRERHRRGLFAWMHNKQQAFSRAYTRAIRKGYGPFLEFVLRHRYLTVSIAFTVLIIMLAYAMSGRMGMGLFPTVESDYSDAQIVLPYGSPIEKTEAIMDRLLESARSIIEESGHPELVESITADIGRGGSHMARMRVNLADAEIRNKIMSNTEFTNRWRERVGEVTGVEYMRFASDSGGPGGRGRPLTVELSHRDIDVLHAASKELAAVIATYPRVKDVDDGFQPGKEQLDFTIKPEGKSLGLTAFSVARQVRSAFYGAEALRQQRKRNEIKVMVRLPEEERSSEETINDLMIRTPAGTYVPLREVASVKRGRAYMSIDRRNGRRVVQVTGDITPRSKAGEVLSDLKETALKDLENKYPGLFYSFEGHQADMAESLGSLRVTFVLALLAIYALLAIPFRSYSQPLIVMVSIPFGIVGAFIGHLIMGYDLCIPSMFGIVALSGVVVNDSLIMIDFANRREKAPGMTHHDAIHSAAIQRFRPIMLTTLTTFGGLAPMIFETSRQARFLIPMALSLGYGILFATFITLIIVPSLYMVVADYERARASIRKFFSTRAPEPAKEQHAPSLTLDSSSETS
jgi:multidrug efflux pump subunit AcrB